jgi:hypothetical protein
MAADLNSEGGAAERASDEEILRRYIARSDVPCPSCGYNLRAGSVERCPECGAALDLSLILQGQLHRTMADRLLDFDQMRWMPLPIILMACINWKLHYGRGPLPWGGLTGFVLALALLVIVVLAVAFVAGALGPMIGERTRRRVVMAGWGLLALEAVTAVVIRLV